MKKSQKTVSRKKSVTSNNNTNEKSAENSGGKLTHETSAAISATHAARKGITSAKKLPGHPVRKVDARSLHRILTWSIELNQRQKQLMDAALEILSNAKNV